MDKGDIYLITSPSGKEYIGQAVKFLPSGKKYGYIGRWNGHKNEAKNNKNYCRVLDHAIRKYGFESFSLSLIETVNIEDLDKRENYWIERKNTMSPNGYNLTTGKSNSRQSLETRELRRKSMIGKNKGKLLPKMKRIRDEDSELPKYVRSYYDKSGKSGYRISNHPNLKDKSFVSKKLSMEEKLKLALQYLRIDLHIAVQRPNGSGPEEGIPSPMKA